MASPTKIMVKVSCRTIKKQGKVSRGAIWWDYHLGAIAKVSGGTIKWTYYFEVRYQARQSGGITFYVEVKQRYQVEL